MLPSRRVTFEFNPQKAVADPGFDPTGAWTLSTGVGVEL